jgi:hypothetical protein
MSQRRAAAHVRLRVFGMALVHEIACIEAKFDARAIHRWRRSGWKGAKQSCRADVNFGAVINA